ncbi:hypothetical protein IU427_29935 [Nocardia beijingensis]|uniref:hypothetical protein n=1 Tax=Nocardia beijingensis TaxID=95162 RepID=UPI001893A9E3|nr:hypothetical protein [Nocardia beijingensis]MBF6469357.1 hypothetical protein [Nocardia beijingensis]
MFDEWYEECVRSPQYPAPEPGQDLWLLRIWQIARRLNLGWLFSTWSLSKLRDMLTPEERVDIGAFPEFPRARWPQEEPYLILDNDAAHNHLKVREWHRRRGRVGVRAYPFLPVNPDRVRVRRDRRPHPPERPARRTDPQLRHRFQGPAPGLPEEYCSTM